MSMLEQINDGIKIVAEDQSDMKKDIKSIKLDIDTIKGDIDDMKYVLKEKANYDSFEKMEKRMVKLEKLVFVNQA